MQARRGEKKNRLLEIWSAWKRRVDGWFALLPQNKIGIIFNTFSFGTNPCCFVLISRFGVADIVVLQNLSERLH